MEIIKRFKEQADKMYDYLKEEGVLTQEESEVNREQVIQQCQAKKIHNLENKQTSQFINPYIKKRQQLIKSNAASKCVVCRSPGKYRCPQCLISYCSSGHYKSHNLFCSEQFFKKQVQSQMKSIKASKQQKKKTLQFLKQNNNLQAKDQQGQLNQFNEQRLVKLLEMIEKLQSEGKQITNQILGLTIQQEKKLQQYIQNIQSDNISQSAQIDQSPSSLKKSQQQTQNPLHLQFTQPYWLISDGLDFYFMQQLQIQQFSQSAYPQLICYRQLASKKYRSSEIKQLQHLLNNGKIKLSQLFQQDILQYMIIFVEISLCYNNEIMGKQNQQQVYEVFNRLYIENLCKMISQQGITKNQEAGRFTLAKIRQKISNMNIGGNESIRKILSQWYKTQAIKGCKIIVKNKYLMVETFLRLLEMFEHRYRKISQVHQKMTRSKDQTITKINQNKSQSSQQQKQMNNIDKNSKYLTQCSQKQLKKLLNQSIKHIKKIQLILSYIKNELAENKMFNNDEQNKQLQIHNINANKNNEKMKANSDLFRSLYRILINEEQSLIRQQEENRCFKKQINDSAKGKKNGGILFK